MVDTHNEQKAWVSSRIEQHKKHIGYLETCGVDYQELRTAIEVSERAVRSGKECYKSLNKNPDAPITKEKYRTFQKHHFTAYKLVQKVYGALINVNESLKE